MVELNVLASGGFRGAYLVAIEGFERATGHTTVNSWGGSVGDAPTSIPSRVKAGEVLDVVIMSAEGLDALTEQGRVVAGSRVDLARGGIGVIVRAGAPRPDITSVDAMKRALVEAPSIMFSNGASVGLILGMVEQLGLTDVVSAKRVQGATGSVPEIVGRGDAAIGLQLISELIGMPGVDFVGPLPPEVQAFTVFSCGIPATAQHPEAARALLEYLSSPAVASAIVASGMEPC